MNLVIAQLCFFPCLVDLKTLVIKNLSEETTAETLKSAVKEAVTARVILDKETGASKRWEASGRSFTVARV